MSAQAQDKIDDEDSYERGNNNGSTEPNREWQPQILTHERRGVSSNSHKKRLPKRNLPCVARQQIEADRADGSDTGVNQKLDPEFPSDEQDDQQANGRQHDPKAKFGSSLRFHDAHGHLSHPLTAS